jgi:protein-glucosylgalactosylhydroxylysine glucosidase
MLSAPLGAWAARLGDRVLSGRLFESGYADFIDEPFRVTNEFSKRFRQHPRAAPLLANVGGFLSGCLYELTGIVLGPGEPHTWPQRRASMPNLWEGIEVERIWAHGRPFRLTARHGEMAKLDPI